MRTSALAPLALAAALLLTAAGCAADEPTSTDDTSQNADTDADTDNSTDTESVDDAGTSDLVPVFTDAPATPGPQMAITADGFEPADLTVSAGDIVTFTSGDDGMYGLIVNQLDGVTVARSIPEYYQFNDPGTYYLKEDISGNTGTITVE